MQNKPFKAPRVVPIPRPVSYKYTRSQGENKFFDTVHNFSIDFTGEVPATGQLNLIPQGVTDSTRVGRKCVIKSIQMKGQVRLVPAASATAADMVVIYVVLDRQANGAAAAVTDVLTGTDVTISMLNLTNSQRFKILKKFTFALVSTAGVTTAYNNVVKPLKWFKKCNIPLEFSGATGAITELRSNNIFLLAGSGLLDDISSYVGTTRIRYSD